MVYSCSYSTIAPHPSHPMCPLPAAFHADCLGLVDAEVQAAKRWTCPQHSCSICHRAAQVRNSSEGLRPACGSHRCQGCQVEQQFSQHSCSALALRTAVQFICSSRPLNCPQAVGGMLFRCEGCCHAFCEDHLPEDADVVREGRWNCMAARNFPSVTQDALLGLGGVWLSS